MEERREFDLGEWRVQPTLNRLTRDEQGVRIEPKLMDVLLFLALRPQQVVSKDEIAGAVWPETFITESVITRAIAGLRRAFGDDARSPRYIETIAKRGYRLLLQPAAPARAVGKADLPVPSAGASEAAADPPGDAGELSGSPFVVGQWVRGERFYGREEEIREILHGPRNGIWVLGSRAVGKTSLLKQLEHLTAADQSDYFPLFWDLQGTVEPGDLHEDFACALAEAEESLGRVGLELSQVQAEDFFVSIGRLRRALRARGRRLLLLWDEVEELVHLHGRWPVLLRKLRRALQSQEGIRTVIASGPRLWQLAQQRDDTSPFLHGFAPPLYLGPLADATAVALVRQDQNPRPGAPIPDAGTLRELLGRSGNHPSLLQLLCQRFLESRDLEAATDAVVSDLTVSYFLSVDFDLVTPLEREVLLALAREDSPVTAEGLGLEASPQELATRLQHLERLGQVKRSEAGELEIAGEIRRRWLEGQGREGDVRADR